MAAERKSDSAEGKDEVPEGGEGGNEVVQAHPERHFDHEDRAGQAEGAAHVALALCVVSPRHQRASGQKQNGQITSMIWLACCPGVRLLVLRSVGRGPGSNQVKEDGLAPPGGGFDPQGEIGTRPGPRPGGALVKGRERQPVGSADWNCGRIESGGGEEGLPIHRMRRRRIGLHLLGDGLQVAEPALRIKNMLIMPDWIAGGSSKVTTPGVRNILKPSGSRYTGFAGTNT